MQNRTDYLPTLEIIIPVFNESEVIELLFDTLNKIFTKQALLNNKIKKINYIVIDDGSTDDTASKITTQLKNCHGLATVTLHRFSRNFGHQNAVFAGISLSTADLVAIIDADLQDPPEVILEMIKAWRRGYQVVYGIRKKRKENKLLVFCYWLYYRVISFLSEVDISKDSGDFCLMDKKVIYELKKLPEYLKFPRGLRSWVGFKQIGIPYERFARTRGKSKYNLKKLYTLGTHGIASMSIKPLKTAQFFSLISVVISLFFSGYCLKKYLLGVHSDNNVLFFLFTYLLITVYSGMTMFTMYIMSAYIGRIYLEVKSRPSFIIQETIFSRDYNNVQKH